MSSTLPPLSISARRSFSSRRRLRKRASSSTIASSTSSASIAAVLHGAQRGEPIERAVEAVGGDFGVERARRARRSRRAARVRERRELAAGVARPWTAHVLERALDVAHEKLDVRRLRQAVLLGERRRGLGTVLAARGAASADSDVLLRALRAARRRGNAERPSSCARRSSRPRPASCGQRRRGAHGTRRRRPRRSRSPARRRSRTARASPHHAVRSALTTVVWPPMPMRARARRACAGRRGGDAAARVRSAAPSASSSCSSSAQPGTSRAPLRRARGRRRSSVPFA